MSRIPNHCVRLVAAGSCLVYAILYLLTTTVTPKGTGGLTGPLKVRVFRSESHLLVFYPLYLIERCVRNLSLTDASYKFNADFRDAQYKRLWLYGDGKYSRIWYDVF